MHALLPIVVLLLLLGLIWYLGSGKFGRAQTQSWIDQARSHPRVFDWLNRHHGKFRAASHYFEFGGLFLVFYWLYDSLWAHANMAFNLPAASIIAVVCALAALLDELHQLQSGTRQFRREDFLHSCCGICIAAALVEYTAWLRNT